jgi:cellobiose transport system permease protein
VTNVDAVQAQTAAAPTPSRQRQQHPKFTPNRRRFRWVNHWHYVVLVIAVLVSIFPFYWIFVVASNTSAVTSQVPPRIIPGPNFVANATEAMSRVPFVRALVNSFVVATVTTVSSVFFGTLAGFAFAKMRFRGRNVLMTFVIATMLIPLQQLGLIPLYMLMDRFGWVGSLRAVIVPALVTGFAVFWMRQVVATSVHDELLEAGRIDGCSMWGLFRHVVIPSVRSGAAVLGMFVFLFAWNDFLWPLVVLGGDQSSHTIQIALRQMNQTYYAEHSMVLAGTFMSLIPLLIVFVIFSRQMIAGVMEGAVKG